MLKLCNCIHVVLFGMVLVFTGQAYAADAAQGPMQRHLGAGLSIGNPTTVTARYHLPDKQNYAAELHLGIYKAYGPKFHRDSIFLGGGLVLHVWTVFDHDLFDVPVYTGAGAFVSIHLENDVIVCRGDDCQDDSILGVGLGGRFPLGASMRMKGMPFEGFVEFGPTLGIFIQEAQAATTLRFSLDILNVALGARFYFQ